ncbi:MAG TPA: hypothetical protein DEP47_00725 [Chloroflexi bacterium]|nr:hypothetical protein [Chloroflexota bacterium]
MNEDVLIRTKFQRPSIGPDILPRPRLIERLENGRHRKLTLISAPAGYGKSILASIWSQECSCLSAYLSLDKKDNDLGVFISYFISALQTIFPDSFPGTMELMNGQQLPSLDIISTRLLNEAASTPQPFILILDDYHLITDREIIQLTGTLIQYLPAHMHLVLITRQDPPLDIINLRARNQVAEIRLADLRFNKEETVQYLDIKLGKSIAPDLALELFERTEGWAAGLRLAVLALRNHTDQAKLFEVIQGTDHFVMSYLVEQVLSRQPAPVQSFLLKTSLLDRFCTPLCDAILVGEDSGQHINSQEALAHLQRRNLFLISLDQKGEWYRYHHLFQDLLRHQLRSFYPEQTINQLHIRASSWLADHGFVEEALDHAFWAGDMDRAIQIFACARIDLMQQTQWQRLEQLLRRFPYDVIECNPDLLMAENWLYYHHNQWVKLPAGFERLEKLISQSPGKKDAYRYLIGEMSAIHSLLLYYAMDVGGVMAQAESALKWTAPELSIVRVLARMSLAGVQQLAGDLNGAYATILRGFDEEPDHSDTLKAAVLVTACFAGWIAADIHTMQQKAAKVVELSKKSRSPGMLGFGHYFLGMIAYQQNDLSTAKEHFSYVHQRPYTTYDDSFVYSSCGLALTHQQLDREREALDVIDSTMAYLLQTGNSEMLPIVAAFQAELALLQGQMSFASQRANRLDPVPPLSPMTQFYAPHLTLVKVFLAEDILVSREKAWSLLTQIIEFCELTHNTVHLIQALALQAVSQQLDGDESAALETLKKALCLGLPGKFIRSFVDLGPIMANLLSKLAVKDDELADYRDLILAAAAPSHSLFVTSSNDKVGRQPPIEQLTNREMDVLLLLSQRQSDKEIAENLIISPFTVRSHTKNIYSKLGVNNRRQAVTRAQDLGLIPSN